MLGFSTIAECPIASVPLLVLQVITYARAPVGSGYAPQKIEQQFRPPNIQENTR